MAVIFNNILHCDCIGIRIIPPLRASCGKYLEYRGLRFCCHRGVPCGNLIRLIHPGLYEDVHTLPIGVVDRTTLKKEWIMNIGLIDKTRYAYTEIHDANYFP